MNKLLTSIAGMAFDIFVRPSLQLAKIRAALRDRETVQYLRKATLAVCGLVAGAGIMAGGAVLLPLALCLFMPWDQGTRLWVALFFAAIYILIPLVVVAVLLSERRWQRRFQVDDVMEEVAAKR